MDRDKNQTQLEQLLQLEIDAAGAVSPSNSECDISMSLEALALASPHASLKADTKFRSSEDDNNEVEVPLASPTEGSSIQHPRISCDTSSNPEYDLSSPMQLPLSPVPGGSSEKPRKEPKRQTSVKRNAKHGGIYSLLLRNVKKTNANPPEAQEVVSTTAPRKEQHSTGEIPVQKVKPRHGGIYKSLMCRGNG